MSETPGRLATAIMTTNEPRQIRRLLAGLDRRTPILDVGCGRGDKLELLRGFGFEDLTGVDVNPDMVEAAGRRGFTVHTVDDLPRAIGDRRYGLLFFSHIVEHFQPTDLLAFLHQYFPCAADGARVCIVTPLLSVDFFDDFDHVRPYQPSGLRYVFAPQPEQVQYHGDWTLDLDDLRFRRAPLRVGKFTRAWQLQRRAGLVPYATLGAINLALVALWRLSFGLIGRTTGWAGLFRIQRRAQVDG